MPPDPNITQLPAAFRWWPGPGPATDWIDMDHIIRDLSDPLRNQVLAVKFEAVAAMHRAVADGAAQIAKILGGAAGTQRKG